MGFFDLTEQDMNDGKAVFKDGDVGEFVIASVIKKDLNGVPTIIVESIVASGEHAGLKYPQFFRLNSDGGKKALGIFLTAFMSAKEASQLQDPNVLINQKYSCKFVGNKEGYVNSRGFKKVSDVPTGLVQPAPVQQPVQQELMAQQTTSPEVAAIQQQQQQQAELSKGIF